MKLITILYLYINFNKYIKCDQTSDSYYTYLILLYFPLYYNFQADHFLYPHIGWPEACYRSVVQLRVEIAEELNHLEDI